MLSTPNAQLTAVTTTRLTITATANVAWLRCSGCSLAGIKLDARWVVADLQPECGSKIVKEHVITTNSAGLAVATFTMPRHPTCKILKMWFQVMLSGIPISQLYPGSIDRVYAVFSVPVDGPSVPM